MDKYKLKSMTISEIRKVYKKQLKENIWTFYDERNLMENMFSQRFNFLLVTFSLFLVGAATVNNELLFQIILGLGALFTFLVALNLYRAFIKLDIILKILYKLEDYHIFPFVKKEVEQIGIKALVGTNRLVGILIPFLCVLTLIVLCVLSIFDIISVC